MIFFSKHVFNDFCDHIDENKIDRAHWVQYFLIVAIIEFLNFQSAEAFLM